LPEGQVVVLRRWDHAVLATATNVIAEASPDDQRRAPDGVLLTTDRPDSVVTVARGAPDRDGTLTLFGRITTSPAIVAIELPESDRAGRTRFGVTPPPALSTMARGDIAISDAVILRVRQGTESLPSDPEAVLRHMAGSAVVREGTRLGVYWETYGIGRQAPLKVAVHVQRTTAPSRLGRLGRALGLTGDRNATASVEFSLVQAEIGGHVLDAPSPIISRTVVLDTSGLPAGDYALGITAESGGRSVTTKRTFTIR
jgi:hypothetical protein